MQNLDIVLTQFINGLSGHVHLLDIAIETITQIGVPLLILAVGISWWVGANARADRHVAVASALSFVIGLALNQLVLLVVHRVRPYRRWRNTSSHSSQRRPVLTFGSRYS